MKTLCIIPARGGSQRVLMKNIIPLLGRPCLAYTVDCIREATVSLTTVLLTDSSEIADVATTLGVDVIHEPAEIAGNGTVDDAVFSWFVLQAVECESDPFDIILIQYPCVPIRPKGIIDSLLEFMIETGADYVQTVAPVPSHAHPYKAVFRDSCGRVTSLHKGGPAMMSQDFPKLYFFTAAGVAVTRNALAKLKDTSIQDETLNLDRRSFVHDPDECVDIDDPRDVVWAEFLLSRR